MFVWIGYDSWWIPSDSPLVGSCRIQSRFAIFCWILTISPGYRFRPGEHESVSIKWQPGNAWQRHRSYCFTLYEINLVRSPAYKSPGGNVNILRLPLSTTHIVPQISISKILWLKIHSQMCNLPTFIFPFSENKHFFIQLKSNYTASTTFFSDCNVLSGSLTGGLTGLIPFHQWTST